jgi:Pyruvate/2-oxoacid:ferredoxin oxidoreductase gamma subunit
MATRLLDRVPTERIEREARQVHLGRALLTVLVGLFWAVGWLAGKATLAVGFAYAAAKVGYLEARNVEAGELRRSRESNPGG